MKNYFRLRKYQGSRCNINFGVVAGYEPYCNYVRGEYQITYWCEDLLSYEELDSILKEYGYKLEEYIEEDGKIKNELLELIFSDAKLRYKLNIVEVMEFDDDVEFWCRQTSQAYYCLGDIRNQVYTFNLKRIG